MEPARGPLTNDKAQADTQQTHRLSPSRTYQGIDAHGFGVFEVFKDMGIGGKAHGRGVP